MNSIAETSVKKNLFLHYIGCRIMASIEPQHSSQQKILVLNTTLLPIMASLEQNIWSCSPEFSRVGEKSQWPQFLMLINTMAPISCAQEMKSEWKVNEKFRLSKMFPVQKISF